MLTWERYVEAVADGRDRLVAAARTAGPEARVPCSSRWTVADLLIHTGHVHDWAADVLQTGVEQPQYFDVPPVGVATGDLTDWYAERVDALLSLLTPLSGRPGSADQPVWTFGPPGTALFWPRRQAHETTMHAVDARLAAGEPVLEVVGQLDPELSTDGVAELLTVMVPRVALFAARPDLPSPLAIEATDTGQRWELETDGHMRAVGAGPAVGATLSGSAAALFVLLWRRARLASGSAALGVRVDGDPAVVTALAAARLTP